MGLQRQIKVFKKIFCDPFRYTGFVAKACLKSTFLPRDALHKRGQCCRAVSVRPSVTFVYRVETYKYYFQTFFHSHTIPVFTYKPYRNILTATQ